MWEISHLMWSHTVHSENTHWTKKPLTHLDKTSLRNANYGHDSTVKKYVHAMYSLNFCIENEINVIIKFNGK